MTATAKYDWIMIHPKNAVFLKHLAAILKRREKRLCQSALYRIAVMHAESPEKYLKRANVRWALGFSSNLEASFDATSRSMTDMSVDFEDSETYITGRELDVAKMSSSITIMVNNVQNAILRVTTRVFDNIVDVAYDTELDSFNTPHKSPKPNKKLEIDAKFDAFKILTNQ